MQAGAFPCFAAILTASKSLIGMSCAKNTSQACMQQKKERTEFAAAYAADAEKNRAAAILNLVLLGLELLFADTELAAPVSHQFAQFLNAQLTDFVHANEH